MSGLGGVGVVRGFTGGMSSGCGAMCAGWLDGPLFPLAVERCVAGRRLRERRRRVFPVCAASPSPLTFAAEPSIVRARTFPAKQRPAIMVIMATVLPNSLAPLLLK
jgi:hypothetical protein